MKRSPQSNQYCKDTVLRRAKNFGVALKFLPKEKKEAVYALYAFARLADDVVDGDNLSLDLTTLKDELDKVYRTPFADSYSWHAALGQAIRRYNLPKNYFEELLIGMGKDAEKTVYRTWHDTEEYCYQAASTVGLLCLEIFGYDWPDTKVYAKSLGIAMQLTNILRDLREDHKRGRQYFPSEDFEAYKITPNDLIQASPVNAVQSFLNFQIDRTATYFEQANKLYSFVDKDARFCPKALGLIYQEYLKQMKQRPLISLRGKLKIKTSKKIMITLKSRFG